MSPARRFDAVLFDMDGVLVDSGPWWYEVRVAFAAGQGRRWTHDDEVLTMGGNSREWAEVMQRSLDLPAIPVLAIQESIVAGVVERYRTRPAPVIGDAPAEVRRIARDYRVAIASSSHPDVIEATVGALGLADDLGAVVSSDEVPAGKPAPDVYRLAAERLGVAPERCLVVEDSINGVRAARAAGMTVVLVPNASVPPAARADDEADHVVESLAALDPAALPA